MDEFPGTELRRRAARPVAAVMAAMLALSGAALVVPADALSAFGGPGPGQGSLSLQAPATSVAGQPVSVVATWSNQFGQFGPPQISLFLDRSPVGTQTPNGQGVAAFTIPGSQLMQPGTHFLAAVAGGGFGRFRGGNTASASLNVLPAPAVTPAVSTPAPAQPPVVVAAIRQVPTPTPGPSATAIAIGVPAHSPLGQDAVVTGTFTDMSGSPIADQRLTLLLDGNPLDSGTTDAAGHMSFSIPGRRLKQAGSHAVQAAFTGTHTLVASSADATIIVDPAAIEIKTVPATAGLAFTMNGVTAVTAADGSATLAIAAAGTYKLTTDLNPTSASGSLRASFVRWADGVETADRTLTVDGSATYTMGLRIASVAHIDYVDAAGRAVDPESVDSAVFKAGDGTNVALNHQTGTRDIWWTASTTMATGTAVTATPVTYQALSVKVHGTEVLAPDQRAAWTPSDGGTWTIRLQVYDLSIRTQDALLGTPLSGKANLALANGSSIAVAVGTDGTATFHDLPSGQYTIHLDSAALSSAQTVTVAPAQPVQTLRVVTFSDLVALAMLLLLLVMALGAALAIAFVVRRRRMRIPA
jgi:hypothetical protein